MKLDTTVKFFDERGELVFLPSISDSLVENILGTSTYVKRLESFNDVGVVPGGLYDRSCFVNRNPESFTYGQYKLFMPMLYQENVKEFKKLNPFKTLSSFFNAKSRNYLRELWSIFVEYKDANESNADVLMNERFYKVRFRYIDFEDDVDNIYNCGVLGLYKLFSTCTPLNKRKSSNFQQISRLFNNILVVTPINKRSRFLYGTTPELPYITKAYEAFGTIENNLKSFIKRDDISLIDKASACAAYGEAYNDLVYRVMRGYFDFDKKNWALTTEGKLRKRLRLIPTILETTPKDTLVFSRAMLYRVLKEEIILRLMSMDNVYDPFKEYLLGTDMCQKIFDDIVSSYKVAVSRTDVKTNNIVVFNIKPYEQNTLDKFNVNGIGCNVHVHNSFKNCGLFSSASYTFFKSDAEPVYSIEKLNVYNNWFYNNKSTIKSTITLQNASGLFKATTSIDCDDDITIDSESIAKTMFSEYELKIDKLVTINDKATTIGKILVEDKIGINPLVFNDNHNCGLRIKDLHKVVAYLGTLDKTGILMSSFMDFCDSCSVCDSYSTPNIKNLFGGVLEDENIETIDDISQKSEALVAEINKKISELSGTIQHSDHPIYGHTIHLAYDGWEILDTLQSYYTNDSNNKLNNVLSKIQYFSIVDGASNDSGLISCQVGHGFGRTKSSGAIIEDINDDKVYVYSSCARKNNKIFTFEVPKYLRSVDTYSMYNNTVSKITGATPNSNKTRVYSPVEYSAVNIVDGLSTINTLNETKKILLSPAASLSCSLFKGASGEKKLLYSKKNKENISLESILSKSLFGKGKDITIAPVNGYIEYFPDKKIMYCGDLKIKLNDDNIYFFENKGVANFGDMLSDGITTYTALKSIGLKDTIICELLYKQINNFGFYDIDIFEFELIFKAYLIEIGGVN